MRFFRFAAVIPMVLLLTSCVGEEPDNIAYVTAMGIDKAENDTFTYTIQFANPTKISGGASESGGSGKDIVENIAVEAPTIYSAINDANSILSKNLSLSHAKVIVVSEETARGGISGIIDVISRNNDIRPDVYLAIAENAGKYLEEVKPTIELNPVKYYQLTYDNKNSSSIPRNTASDFFASYLSGSRDCILPLSGVAEKGKEDSEQSNNEGSGGGSEGGSQESKSFTNESQKKAEIIEEGFENKTRNYFAGEAGEKIKNKSETLGMALFDSDQYIGKLGSRDAEIYNILTNKFSEDNISFYSDSGDKRPITVKLEQKTGPKYKIDKGKKSVDVYLRLEGELLSLSIEYKESNTMDEMNKKMSDMFDEAAVSVIEKMYKENKIDPLGIKGKLKKKFLTINDYENECKEFKPEEWSFNIKSDITLKRTGMTYYY